VYSSHRNLRNLGVATLTGIRLPMLGPIHLTKRTPRAALLCLPTLSTHGYEVIARNAIPAVTRVLAAFLGDPAPASPSRA
jgi:hypothetical protein